MVEHALDIRGVIADRAARLRVRKSETWPVKRDVPPARVIRRLVRNEAPPGRAMAVNDRRSSGIGIAPHGETHMPAIADLQAS